MNNANAHAELLRCRADLDRVKIIIDGLGLHGAVVPYLTNYSIVRACGGIEISFKTIIADYCSHRSKPQVKAFLNRRVREGSANPSYGNILKTLKDFDEGWSNGFKTRLGAESNKQQLLGSLQSLVDARNDFAHGGSPSLSINDVIGYFSHSRRIIELLDATVC